MTQNPVLDAFDHAWITSFWGWSPQTWGCIGFTQEGRQKSFLEKESFPFLMVIYVTEATEDEELRGKVIGFYEIAKIAGDRDDFMHPQHFNLKPSKWRYSLKASRAFEILPEYRPTIRSFDPSIREEGRELPVAKHAAPLPDSSFQLLKSYPIREVPVFGCNTPVDSRIWTVEPQRGNHNRFVSGGAYNGAGYNVPPETDSEKELYILKLNGDPDAFLGEDAGGRSIFKVGLSISPETRRNCFNRALPQGAFKWQIYKTSTAAGHARYPDFRTAEKGEMAMKKYLAENEQADWLGGEFYLASDEAISRAWTTGRETALKAIGGKNG